MRATREAILSSVRADGALVPLLVLVPLLALMPLLAISFYSCSSFALQHVHPRTPIMRVSDIL